MLDSGIQCSCNHTMRGNFNIFVKNVLLSNAEKGLKKEVLSPRISQGGPGRAAQEGGDAGRTAQEGTDPGRAENYSDSSTAQEGRGKSSAAQETCGDSCTTRRACRL